MKIDYILTFDKGRQTFGRCEIDGDFPTKESAVYFFKGLVNGQKRHLIKVSMCIHCDQEKWKQLPQWYMDSDGKLWSDDLGTVRWNKHWGTLSA